MQTEKKSHSTSCFIYVHMSYVLVGQSGVNQGKKLENLGSHQHHFPALLLFLVITKIADDYFLLAAAFV